MRVWDMKRRKSAWDLGCLKKLGRIGKVCCVKERKKGDLGIGLVGVLRVSHHVAPPFLAF